MNKQYHPYMFAAVYLALIKKGEVLLLERQNTGFEDGNFGLVAGHVENTETVTNAIIREAGEEAGITISPDDLTFFHIMQRASIKDRIYVDFFFSAENWKGKIINMEPAKCNRLKWFPINNLPDNTIPYIKLVLQNHLNNLTVFSEYGF